MTKPNSQAEHKKQLRRQLGMQRRQLTRQQQQQYTHQFSQQIRRCRPIIAARRIGIYLPILGEAPAQLIQHLSTPSTQIYIPHIVNYQRHIMCFTPITNKQRPNRWAIKESTTLAGALWPKQLDVVVMPLLAFDSHGNRLGMGGGFYDRAFAYKQYQSNITNRPKLIGLAYDFQQVTALPVDDWDIRLDMVVTNRQVIYNHPSDQNH